jgi:hypothetical protein
MEYWFDSYLIGRKIFMLQAYEIEALIRSKIKPITLDALKLSNQKIQYAQ